jgi:hypothetical protein
MTFCLKRALFNRRRKRPLLKCLKLKKKVPKVKKRKCLKCLKCQVPKVDVAESLGLCIITNQKADLNQYHYKN